MPKKTIHVPPSKRYLNLIIQGYKDCGYKNNYIVISRNKKIKVVDQSITNYEKIEKYFKNVDYVFHLAGLADIVPSIENPSKYFDTNVKGTLNVLKASKKNNVKK